MVLDRGGISDGAAACGGAREAEEVAGSNVEWIEGKSGGWLGGTDTGDPEGDSVEWRRRRVDGTRFLGFRVGLVYIAGGFWFRGIRSLRS